MDNPDETEDSDCGHISDITAVTVILFKSAVKWFYQKKGGEENAAETIRNKVHKK